MEKKQKATKELCQAAKGWELVQKESGSDKVPTLHIYRYIKQNYYGDLGSGLYCSINPCNLKACGKTA